MKIEVWDADYSFSDLDDHLTTFEDNAYMYTVYPFETGGSSLLSSYRYHKISRNITQDYINMYVAVWAVCNRGSYGSDCSVNCVPQKRVRHYGCDISTGAKVCIPGKFIHMKKFHKYDNGVVNLNALLRKDQCETFY